MPLGAAQCRCQQALVNRLEPIFEKVFDPSSFGYRKGRKTADALTPVDI